MYESPKIPNICPLWWITFSAFLFLAGDQWIGVWIPNGNIGCTSVADCDGKPIWIDGSSFNASLFANITFNIQVIVKRNSFYNINGLYVLELLFNMNCYFKINFLSGRSPLDIFARSWKAMESPFRATAIAQLWSL
jgi:hypothetical protein